MAKRTIAPTDRPAPPRDLATLRFMPLIPLAHGPGRRHGDGVPEERPDVELR
jgi:hypothetical protein